MIESLRNERLAKWVRDVVELCTPSKVFVCDGSDEEAKRLTREVVKSGSFIPLNESKKPNSFLIRTHPADVARVEERTFICSKKESDAGPTNRWRDPKEMKKELLELFRGCMRGRTLYVIPFCMGPLGSNMSHIGVELTDSPYVALSMRIMARVGEAVLDLLEDEEFVPCLHSIGKPLSIGEEDVSWPCNPEKTVIAHFPETKEIWSFGSGYGGNALLGKKCLALRIASVMAREEDWMAEHMLIVGVTNPKGVKKYFAAAFPSACGKTNLAMMQSALPEWKVECVGDDIAWMKWSSNGVLMAINPEAGFFGVAPGTSMDSNPNALLTCRKNTLFTNVALTDDKDVWWEGMSKTPPAHLIDWLGQDWTPNSGIKAAHPNSRFTAPASQCPIIDPQWEDPIGVPISAILFGGRRKDVLPLVMESFDWAHGVLMGASISSETTAAAEGEIGKLRHDPFAMLPFCGYNMGDYFSHWLHMGSRSLNQIPKVYTVNWFRKDAKGNYLWPGFGENIRVLKWIFERCEDAHSKGNISAVGILPQEKEFDLSGLSLSEEGKRELFSIDPHKWSEEIKEMRSYFAKFQDRFPQALTKKIDDLEERLNREMSSK